MINVIVAIVYLICILGLLAGLIYMSKDFQKYKEAQKIRVIDTTDLVEKEAEERKSNVNYVVTETNKMNQGMYDELKTEISDVKTEVTSQYDRYDKVIKLVDPRTGTNTSLNTSTNTTTSSVKPDINLMTKVNIMGGMTVKDIAKVDKLRLGDKFLLSAIGDAHANDDWLRMFDKDGKGYSGGIAMGKLWVGGPAYFTNELMTKGGRSEHNPNGWWTHFNWSGDNRNYIRGDTEIRGNTQNIGDLSVNRNLNVQGRIHFKDPETTIAYNGVNNSDSYYLEKKIVGPNDSHLRLTLNDDPQESLQIWGYSCAAPGGCAGEGAMKHKFDALGNATHTGTLKTNNGVVANRNGTQAWTPAVDIEAPLTQESLFSIRFVNTPNTSTNTGMGYITGQPNKNPLTRNTLATHISANDDYALYSDGWNPLFSVKGGSGDVKVKNKLCLGDVCIDAAQLQSLKTKNAI